MSVCSTLSGQQTESKKNVLLIQWLNQLSMYNWSHLMTKPVYVTCEQQRHISACAVSAFVVRCLDSIIPLVSISEISSIYLASVAAQACLCLTWSQTPTTLVSVQGIASPDCATCLIHLKCYGTFLSPILLPSSEPLQVGLLACGLFCCHLWDK